MSVSNTILGVNTTLTIAATVFDTKRVTNGHIGADVFKDNTNAGKLKHVGLPDDWLDVEIYTKIGDFEKLVEFADTDANNAAVPRTVSIVYESLGGVKKTLAGSGFVSSVDVADADAEQKNVVSIHIEFIGRVKVT